MWWKFYTENYLPFMYGLLKIEDISERENKAEKMENWKLEFKQEMIKYLEEEQIFYMEDHLDRMLKFSMKNEFKTVLYRYYDEWPAETMNDIFNIVEKVTGFSL